MRKDEQYYDNRLEELRDFRSGKNDFVNNLKRLDIKDYGIPIEDFYNPEYQHEITKEDFEGPKIGSTGEFGKQEDFRIINLYRYMSDSYGPSEIGPNTRQFCKDVVALTSTTPITFRQIQSITPNPGLGRGGSNIYSVFRFRGGSNCKHKWVKFKFDTESLTLVRAPADDQPNQVSLR